MASKGKALSCSAFAIVAGTFHHCGLWGCPLVYNTTIVIDVFTDAQHIHLCKNATDNQAFDEELEEFLEADKHEPTDADSRLLPELVKELTTRRAKDIPEPLSLTSPNVGPANDSASCASAAAFA